MQNNSRAAKMCRSTDFQGSYFNDQDRLKVKSFFVRLSNLHGKEQLPESLTLDYLPRINETALEISGKSVRPDSPAFVTLHRNVTAKTSSGEAIYGSRERVVASEGVTFEVYLREEKVLKGIFRKDDEEEWKLECKSALERKINSVDHDVAVADVCVGLEGNVVLIERVKMVVKRKRNGRRCGKGLELAEIPEERGVDIDGYESDGCRCCCSRGEEESESDGGDLEEMNIEGVSWAVDVGIWVMCLGVGYLVSKASVKSLSRKRIF
ncbi:hypothetical protein Pint_14828 [Pistacia integerrima]|uniref:Uncharacterized protein n=1 Tax=Pistacia integerrima TaxID=434235 RepID=A0ACC0ZCD0_9ROSI|nr:hypothetical protein Pint_14828 [Pistacia integerrima]